MPGVSYRPSETSEGGAIPPGVYRFKNSHFEHFVYPSGPSAGRKTFAFAAVLVSKDSDQEYSQMWSAGDPEAFSPSSSGENANPPGPDSLPQPGPCIAATGKRDRLSKSTNFVEFVESLIDCQYPEAEMTGNTIHDFDGLEAYLDWAETKHDRSNMEQPAEGQRRRTTLLKATSIEKLPWAAIAAPVTASANGPGAGLSAADELIAFLVAEIPAGGSATIAVARTAVFGKRASSPNKVEMAKLLGDKAFQEGLAAVGITAANNTLTREG